MATARPSELRLPCSSLPTGARPDRCRARPLTGWPYRARRRRCGPSRHGRRAGGYAERRAPRPSSATSQRAVARLIRLEESSSSRNSAKTGSTSRVEPRRRSYPSAVREPAHAAAPPWRPCARSAATMPAATRAALDRRRHPSPRSRHHSRGPHGSPLSWVGARLVGALLLGQNDEWAVRGSRAMTLERIAQTGDDPTVSLTEKTG